MSNLETKEMVARYLRYKEDPWAFLSECVFTLDQVDSENPIKRFPSHFDYLRFFTELWKRENLIAVPKSRRMTMSWTCLSLIAWEIFFHPGKSWAVVSKKEDDSGELVRRIEFIINHIPEDKIPSSLRPKIKNGKMKTQPPHLELDFGKESANSEVRGFAQGADQLRQFTLSGIFGDECAFWEKAQAFYSASKPTIDGGGRMILVSSRAPGFFKKIVFDQIDYDGYDFPEVPPAEAKTPLEGVELTRNPKNRFVVMDIHYTANPAKRGKAFRDAVKASMPYRDFMMEYEKNWNTFEGLPVFEDFNKERHTTLDISVTEPQFGLPLVCGWDFGLCYDDQTEVLTDSGWKLFKDVNEEEDKVATLDPNTFKATFHKPEMKVDMPYKGDLYYCNGQNINFAITPDHIIPNWTESGKFERHHAKDLLEKPGHRKLRLTAEFEEGKECSMHGLPANIEAALLGLYLSDGTSDGKKLRITQVKKNEYLDWVMKQIPWEFKKYKQGYELNNTVLASVFKQYGVQKERRIPNHIINGTKQMKEYFLAGYTSGDGHIRIRENESEEHTIFTCSDGMANDFQTLAAMLGWSSSIRKSKPTTSYYREEQRWITNTGGYNVTFKKSADWAELRSYKYEKRHYDGRVYCLKVPNHILYVRRGGKPHWNGNTPACIVAQLRDNTLYIIKEFIAKNKSIKRFAPEVITSLRVKYSAWSDPQKDFIHFVDPAGFKRAEHDEGTCVKEMRAAGLRNIHPGPMTWEARKNAVLERLLYSDRHGPGLILNAKDCPVLIEGFSGGYRYPDTATDIEPSRIRPIKNSYSHPHDALQYLCGGLSVKKLSKLTQAPPPEYSFQGGSTHTTRTHTSGDPYGQTIKQRYGF